MVAEWFPTAKLGTRTSSMKRFRVPDFHPRERRIRALNVGCLGDDDEDNWEFEIKNISRRWIWQYIRLTKLYKTEPGVKTKGIWLIHWYVTEHRQIMSGDLLQINISFSEGFVGVKLLYEDEASLEEEEEEEEFTSPGWLNTSKKESDDSAADDDVAVWYNRTFCSSNLSYYKSRNALNAPTNWRVYNIEPVGGRDEVIERISEDRATYLGFPNLSVFYYASTRRGLYGWHEAYQAGTYCVCNLRYRSNMLAEWLPTKSGTGPYCFKKRYRVPSFHRPIRALHVGFLGNDKSQILIVENISQRWTWNYYLPWRFSETGRMVKSNVVWLTHWRVMEHRQITSGDLLNVEIDNCECVGVKLIYEDGEGAELEEEEFPYTYCTEMELHRIKTQSEEEEKIIELNNRNGVGDDNGVAAAATDVAVWYNQTFRSTDLSLYQYNRSIWRLLKPYWLRYPVRSL